MTIGARRALLSWLDRRLLITGGAGFIGSNFTHHILNTTRDRVTILDKLTYAGDLKNLAGADERRLHFERVDICDTDAVLSLLDWIDPTHIVHMAAESHVDRSIEGPADFIRSNVTGTLSMLEACRAAKFRGLFLHVSTDEVFGEITEPYRFTEESPYRPSSPYSASKAAADHLVRSYIRTYAFPAVVVNCSNNYGPRQNREKLIPKMISACLDETNLTIHGNGEHVRDWLHVDDCCRALDSVLRLESAAHGQTYLIGGGFTLQNKQIVDAVCRVMDELAPGAVRHASRIVYTQDRPGNDLRYAVDFSRLTAASGWRPRINFTAGLTAAARWYITAHQGQAGQPGESGPGRVPTF